MKQLSVFILLFLCAFMIDLKPISLEDIHTDTIQVYVEGEVDHPGEVTLDLYASAQDALNAAGVNEDADTTTINPAQVLKDKDVIIVPKKHQEGELQRISINTAEKEVLMNLPGIGETAAQRIIAYREEHGYFQSIEDLMKVKGIGKAKYEKLKDLIML